MRESEHDDLLAEDLVRNGEREPIEHGQPPLRATLPLWCRLREAKDTFQDRVDFVFELVAEPRLPLLVVVDLVIDLDHGESMEAKPHCRARAARRRRTCVRYSSSVMVSAVPATTSAARR